MWVWCGRRFRQAGRQAQVLAGAVQCSAGQGRAEVWSGGDRGRRRNDQDARSAGRKKTGRGRVSWTVTGESSSRLDNTGCKWRGLTGRRAVARRWAAWTVRVPPTVAASHTLPSALLLPSQFPPSPPWPSLVCTSLNWPSLAWPAPSFVRGPTRDLLRAPVGTHRARSAACECRILPILYRPSPTRQLPLSRAVRN